MGLIALVTILLFVSLHDIGSGMRQRIDVYIDALRAKLKLNRIVLYCSVSNQGPSMPGKHEGREDHTGEHEGNHCEIICFG